MMEILATFEVLTANNCGLVFVDNPARNFMINNQIITPKFPFNHYEIKNNCDEMINYPQIFRYKDSIVFKQKSGEKYIVCYFNLSPDECKIL